MLTGPGKGKEPCDSSCEAWLPETGAHPSGRHGFISEGRGSSIYNPLWELSEEITLPEPTDRPIPSLPEKSFQRNTAENKDL